MMISAVDQIRTAPLTTMDKLTESGRGSSALARRALWVTAILAMAGALLGAIGILQGTVAGMEAVLIVSAVLFSAGVLITLRFCPTVELQTVATSATVYFGLYLCACSTIAVIGAGRHLNLLIYLVWFFPLLVFNKLVNAPAIGRALAKSLVLAPLLILCCLSWRLGGLFPMEVLFFLAAYGLSYLAFGLMFDTVTRYREEYVVERERAEALKIESTVLESISDCFISVDCGFRLVYLNDAACVEFGVERHWALKRPIMEAVPDFLSSSTLIGLREAAGRASASVFEAQNVGEDLWYEMRCFPRADGLSIYFRNITGSILARRDLEAAYGRVREQADLLDKARDAIIVQDVKGQVLYWNKSAERLYGWAAEQIIGRLWADVFQDSVEELNPSIAIAVEKGEWSGEISQCHRDGSALTVESRCTLVRGDDGQPRSILAIHTDITKRKAAEAEIQQLAFYDALTNLPNRLLLRDRLNKALATAVRTGSAGALLFIDLDRFKILNETLGHDMGDLLLQQVALRIRGCLGADETLARLSGDEFVVTVEELTGDGEAIAAQARTIARRILGAFRERYQIGDCEYHTTASIGVALFPDGVDTGDGVLKRADLAIHRAKAQGRNSICFFDPAMETLVASRAALEADMRRAMQNREFELHYQPQVDSKGCVIGAEALLRWPHPRRGMVGPGEFIPLAEEAGLIVELGRWVLQTACRQIATWAKEPGMRELEVAVNVSVSQLLDANFVGFVQETLSESGADPRRLKLEITESSMMEGAEDVIARMTSLKACGVSFSLDDFGTGYSSLSRLKFLPLDQLKIDRSFVNDVLTDSRDASVARTIITLGRSLHLSVIAEGVETEGQREFLEREGCHAYQGYLFSPALTARGLEAFVAVARARKRMDMWKRSEPDANEAVAVRII